MLWCVLVNPLQNCLAKLLDPHREHVNVLQRLNALSANYPVPPFASKLSSAHVYMRWEWVVTFWGATWAYVCVCVCVGTWTNFSWSSFLWCMKRCVRSRSHTTIPLCACLMCVRPCGGRALCRALLKLPVKGSHRMPRGNVHVVMDSTQGCSNIYYHKNTFTHLPIAMTMHSLLWVASVAKLRYTSILFGESRWSRRGNVV